ncbi:MAG: hypothetical protein AAB723_01625 [Patescibacteria group bacterium]
MKIKKHFIVCLAVMAVVAAGVVYFFPIKQANEKQIARSACQVKEITFYYLEGCEWCNKVKTEGTIDKIEQLGVKINKINAAVGPVRHKFQGVPTFVISGKVYEGYRTFDDLKILLECPKEINPAESDSSTPSSFE